MFCKYCGTKLLDTAAFCHACGNTTNEPPVEQPVQAVSPAQPAYRPSATPVSPVQSVYQQPVQPAPSTQNNYQQPMYQPPVAPVQSVYQPPVQPAYQPYVQPVSDFATVENLQNQTLTFGILGLSLSILGVPGIIFSSIAGNKASALKKLTGQITGKARVGYKLAKAGKIVSIILTVLWTLILPTLLSELLYSFDNPFEYFSF